MKQTYTMKETQTNRVYHWVLTFVLLVCTTGVNAQFTTYNFPEANLTMDFPFDPGKASVVKDLSTNQVRKYVIKAKSGKTVYKAEVEYYKSKDENLEISNYFLSIMGKANEKKNVTYAGKAMLMAKGGNKKNKGIICLFYEGNRLYRLSIKTPGEFATEEEMNNFFGSFNKPGGSSSENIAVSNENNNSNGTSSGTSNNDANYKQFVYEKMWIANEVLDLLGNFNTYNFAEQSQNLEKTLNKLDYSNTNKRMLEEGSVNFSGTRDTEVYANLVEFEAAFGKAFAQKLMPAIEAKIQNAYREHNDTQYGEHSRKRALQAIDELIPVNETCYKFFPNEENIKGTYTYFQTALNDIAGDYYKDLYLCDFHKANQGKVFYSKEPIDPNNIDPSKFTTEFSVNDHIYGIAFLRKKMNDMGSPGKENGSYFFKYFLNMDNDISYTNYVQFNVSDEYVAENKSYFLMDIIPDPTKASQGDAGKWMEKFATLAPRKHNFQVCVYDWQPSTAWASGTLEIDFAGMDRAKMSADAKKTITQVEENLAKSRKLPEAYSKPGATFKSSMLSQANMRAIIKKEWGAHVAEVLKIVVVSDGVNNWKTSMDDYGRPELKHNSCNIFFAYKGTDGKCYFMKESLTFVRDYQGGGKYSSTVRIWSHFDLYTHVRIACENIK